MIAGGAVLMNHGRTKADAAATPERAAPVALVRTQAAAPTDLPQRIAAFGEVMPGKTIGLSFPRAGQVTRLDATPGRRVRAGTVLATLAPDPAGQQAYEQAVTAADLAKREWTRLQELLKLQLATQSQVDTAEKTYRDALGNVKALRQAGGGSGESTLQAPFDGVVVSAPVAQGDRIAAGAPVLQIGHVDVLRVSIGIEPADSRLVKIGTPVSLIPVVGADEEVHAIPARVAELQDVVDAKTLLVNAIVVLPPAESQGLVPGMKVRATFEVGSRRAVAVPRNAVLTDERGSFVYQVADDKARRVDVSKVLESGNLVGISGLKDATLPVVILGNHELEDGMAVKLEAR
jgi:RND family efflux transporter MFP subunit